MYVDLEREFDLLQEVGEGWYAKVFLVEHRKTRSEIVLKALHKDYISKKDVIREFHYSYNLGTLNTAKVLVRTFDILFISNDCYVFAQEYAPFGDMTSNVSDIGIGEIYTKRVAKQIASAVDFLHDHHLVHRDIKLDNVLVFRSDFSKVKLSDFGECRKKGSLLVRFNEWVPYCPPEIVNTPQDTSYSVEFHQDTWQFGVMIYLCLTGNIPWQKADARSDPRYQAFDLWQRSRVTKTPKGFKIFSNKARRLFRKMFDLNPSKRVVNLNDEMQKYSEDKWLTKVPEKPMDEDELSTNMSMLSFHSSLTDKNRLLFTLTRYGVETTVDRDMKKDRIKEWIASSTIEEEEPDEEEEWDMGSDHVTSSHNSNQSSSHQSR
ncbi:Serine/threonine-protein kinase SBK1 [Orchesella cincta]|uniref:Serine/threonine-protein kinase SBK1 n=1 Tax=Orchesella cincta TaxID=48709 RepID=A0A1D2NMP6_ORCCI|nr:Serine/threonine-protein kinase SBK1 [Orchesella cincta]